MFDAATYWRERPIKKFVIKLVDGDEFQNLLISAPNESRAREQALKKTFLSNEHAVVKEIRLAEPSDRKLVEWMGEASDDDSPAIAKEQLHSALRDCVKAMQKVITFEGSEEEFYSALRMAEYLTLEQEVGHV